MEDVSYLADPKVQQLKSELLISSFFMILNPTLTFFYMQCKFSKVMTILEKFPNDVNRDLYAGLAAIAATQITIFIIAIIKYRHDVYLVLSGQGDIPYDKSLIDDLERVRLKCLITDMKKELEAA